MQLRWWSAEDYLPHIAELLFSTGVAAKMVERLIKSESDRRACSYYMNRFRNIVCFLPDALRQSLRDLGLLAAAKRIIHKYMHVINRDHTPALMAPFQATSFLYEVARSTSLHTSLRELGTLAVVKAILSKCNHDTLRARALIIVAHVYGGDESCAEAQQLLVEQDISTAVLQFLKAGLFNKGRYGGFFW